MENEATTKTPIPASSGFPNFAICTSIFVFSITRPSTLVETPLQIALFFCKTKPISSSPYPTQLPVSQRVMKANHPWPLEENKPNRTQFQNRQNEDNHRDSKGLCKSTTNNEQRTLFKTNPIKPNSLAPPETLGVRGDEGEKKHIFASSG